MNGNVLYELGIANAIREPQDMVLMRKKSKTKVPFDITGLTYITYDNLSVDMLREILRETLARQEWHKGKRVLAVSQSLDELALMLMYDFGRNPDGPDRFGLEGKGPEIKLCVSRLIDLGILRFVWKCYKDTFESAYYWTEFGHAVMKHLEIRRLTNEEYEKSPKYQEYLKNIDKYNELKKAIE